MQTALNFIIFFCAAASVFGQNAESAAYKIRAQKAALTIKFQNKTHRFYLPEQIDAARITEAEIMFATEKDGFRYLVINVGGWSREKQNDRQCGAGIESNLLWLKLDPAWKIRDIKSVRYQSCWSGIDLNDPFELTKNSLNVDFDNIRDKLNVKLTYNSAEPEKGFQIKETKLKEY